jgi:hypothetical protein
MADCRQIVSISVIPRDFEEEVSDMRGYPRYNMRIMEISQRKGRARGDDTVPDKHRHGLLDFHVAGPATTILI